MNTKEKGVLVKYLITMGAVVGAGLASIGIAYAARLLETPWGIIVTIALGLFIVTALFQTYRLDRSNKTIRRLIVTHETNQQAFHDKINELRGEVERQAEALHLKTQKDLDETAECFSEEDHHRDSH